MTGSGLFGGVLITLFGIVNCFFGYLYFRVLLGIWGFFLGGALGLSLASEAAPIVILVAGAVGAFLGAFLIYTLFRVGLFIVAAALGYGLTLALLPALGRGDNGSALVGALVFGLAALLLNRPFIIVITAFSGASTIITGAALILDSERVMRVFNERQLLPAFQDTPVLVGLFWMLLALAGILAQLRQQDAEE